MHDMSAYGTERTLLRRTCPLLTQSADIARSRNCDLLPSMLVLYIRAYALKREEEQCRR